MMARRWLTALALALAGFTVAALTVSGQAPPFGSAGEPGGNRDEGEIYVSVGDSGVTIYIAISETGPGSPGTDGTEEVSGGAGGPTCSAFLTNIGNASTGWAGEGLAEHPDSVPWFVQCDNGYAGIAWVPDSAPGEPAVVVTGGDPPVDPAVLAASLLDTMPLPPIALGANPEVGLVAVPTWYWVEGYDGQPLAASRTLGAITVDVEVEPEWYLWTFGDGTTQTAATTGQPYPDESEIQHTYERASVGSSGYAVHLEISFEARYRVNSGPWQALDPVTQTYTRSYPVQQLQAVLTGG